MENPQSQGLKLFLCGGRIVVRGEVQGWAKKYEKPLRTVSMLRRDLWLTEASLFKPRGRVFYYPPGMREKEVRRLLKRERRKRLLWMVGFGLLIPITLPLTPIPGPNIPYFYALGRFILHFQSFRALGKILKEWALKPFPDRESYERERRENCGTEQGPAPQGDYPSS